MIVTTGIHQLEGAIHGSAVTIGNFDGVHRGHQKLITLTCAKAREQRLTSVVITFDPHPLRVLLGPNTPPFITLTEQKLELISDLGPEVTLLLPFDRAMAALSPEAFVQHYLVEGLKVRELIIGHDYHLGKGRSGDYHTLAALGREMGFTVHRLDPVTMYGAVVSSTRIRDLVSAGQVWEAQPLLGRFYQVRGDVVHGQARGGKLLGFPTANLSLADELTPKPGVYAAWIQLGDHYLPAVANVGYNPTFGNQALSVEAHVMDYDGDLYGRRIRIHFVQRIRDERKFAGPEELKARIAVDVELGRRILALPEASPVLSCQAAAQEEA